MKNKMSHCIKTHMIKLDLFAYQPTLGFQGERLYYTLPGAIYSIIIVLCVLEYSIFQFDKMFNYQDPYITVIDTIANFEEIGTVTMEEMEVNPFLFFSYQGE